MYLRSWRYSACARIELQRKERRTYNTYDDQEYANNVSPDTDIIQEGHNAHTKDIEHSNHSQDDGVHQ